MRTRLGASSKNTARTTCRSSTSCQRSPASWRDMSYYEAVGTMLDTTGKHVTMEHLFKKWNSNLTNASAWNWTEMKKRLSAKADDEKWYIVKSVDTMPSEDGQAPFVPNFICLKVQKNVHKYEQAPRLRMKPIVPDSTMDIEAFSANDIVDMKGEFHWRPLENHNDIFILCNVNADTTSEVKAHNFPALSGGFAAGESPEAESSSKGTTAAASAASRFSFGNQPATPANAFTFGAHSLSTAAAPANASSFGSVPVAEKSSRKRTADDALPGRPEKDNEGAACPLVQSDEDDAAFPVLFQKGMIDDMKQELESGLKIKMNYKDGDFEQMLIVEEDLEFARFAEAEQRKTVQECVEKKVLAASAAYAELKEKYEAALFARQYADADENDPVQEQFVAEKQAILKLPDIEESIKEIMAQHGAAMQTHLKDVAERRLSKMEASLAQLEIIQKDIDDNKMQTRDQFKVMRVFPEADSIGTFCAFRPARGINKSVGRADETYPPAYRMVNTLTGVVTIA